MELLRSPEIAISMGSGVVVAYVRRSEGWYEQRRHRGRVRREMRIQVSDVLGRMRTEGLRQEVLRIEREANHGR